jgi:PAS domain S-box-containing protein
MKGFIKRALLKLDKMSRDSIYKLLRDLSIENERMEMVLDSMTDGVVITDKKNCVLLFNKSATRLVPFASGDFMGKCLWEAIDDKEITRFIKDKLEAQEKVFDREFVLGDGPGARIITCSIIPLVRARTIQGNLLHIEDVTEKRSKEARLRRAESLAALTTLTAGVAHEIKNPLGSIGIHIQLIKKIISNKLHIEKGEIDKYLDIIYEEVDRLNMIVMDFLFAVRPMDTKPIAQDINQIVMELVDFLRMELEKEKIKVELELSTIPRIPLDERYMKQALLNLIKNAQEAMPAGGELRLKTLKKDESVLLEITDTGVGIPEDIRDKIFEPYFTTKDFSSGLGLTLVYKIIKEHKGEIILNSKAGEGTTFILSFPIPQGEKRLIGYHEEEEKG